MTRQEVYDPEKVTLLELELGYDLTHPELAYLGRTTSGFYESDNTKKMREAELTGWLDEYGVEN